eukprot:CAMPEP_0174250578 /NCGR_PEP_ID=MMETSP0439-20130205/714_1 /TAXON_ID=0 /ORGANISM="Stereomyxa ramosa, Strain Chinc5" /LENGTH=612 /DNA_ID=CAMNT_0015330697 /DNA_START=99 /DNA_END=1937 /DNA_ORIENTATION=-
MEGKDLDYLVSDYLAEVTMGILARSKTKSEKSLKGGAGVGGYVKEFVQTVWKPLMKDFMDNNIKVITNAGGMNPLALKAEIEKVSQEAGIQVPIVAAISGDDLMPRFKELAKKGAYETFAELEGEEEPRWHEKQENQMMSFNAYLGAFPIAKALDSGAQVIVTGRVADSALALGALIHEFGWKPTDYNLLSQGSLAGHIIECGCQATGGNFTDWKKSITGRADTSYLEEIKDFSGWENVGFPIVECEPNGNFTVTKPAGTGGLVTRFTVGEQMLYEIYNPSAYILPDVICNWQHVTLTQVGQDRVRVEGAKGLPPTPFYKISCTSVNGYKLSGELMIGGESAAKKAEAVGNAILGRARRMLAMRGLPDFLDTNLELLGAEHSYGPHANKSVQETREVLLRISVHHKDLVGLAIFGKEVAPVATSMAPGITGGGSGRPRPQPYVQHSAVLVRKEHVPAFITIGDETTEMESVPFKYTQNLPAPHKVGSPDFSFEPDTKLVSAPLIRICVGRSGDKGNLSNVGVMARKKEFYPFLCSVLTEEVVAKIFGHVLKGKVTRFELPGVSALNFVLSQSLGGGGSCSLLMDRQGKTYAQLLLSIHFEMPLDWVREASKL